LVEYEGKISGVQKHFIEINPGAFVHAMHLCDTSQSCTKDIHSLISHSLGRGRGGRQVPLLPILLFALIK
jgi:hypothetical protein